MTTKPNFTFIHYLKLLDSSNNKTEKQYIFDTGDFVKKENKISLFIEEDLIILQVVDSNAGIHNVRTNSLPYFKGFKLIICSVDTTEEYSSLKIYDESNLLAENKIDEPLILSVDPLRQNYFIGASVDQNYFGNFLLVEQLIYSSSLNENEIKKTREYFHSKFHRDKDYYSKVQIKDGAFLYRNNADNNLIQPDEKKRPKFLNS